MVAPAAKPLARVLEGLDLQAPALPILSNVHAGLYPTDKQEIVALLAKQLESPVEPNLAALQQAHHFGTNTLLRPVRQPEGTKPRLVYIIA